MKKYLKFILVSLLIIPNILDAEEDKLWKWYTFIEENVHYESDVEDSCEYFENVDKNIFNYSDWKISLEKPENKENREIIEFFDNITIDRRINNLLKINSFEMTSNRIKINEIELTDELNNIIPYEILTPIENIDKINDKDIHDFIEMDKFSRFELKLLTPHDNTKIIININYIKEDNDFYGLEFGYYLNDEILTNLYFSNSTINEEICEGNLCKKIIKIDPNQMNNEPITIKTKMYKYRDKLFKCFTKNKLYIPGYYKKLEGFIKDENDYKLIEKENISNTEENKIFQNNQITGNQDNLEKVNEIKNTELESNDLLEENKLESIKEDLEEPNKINNNTIAMITNDKTKKKNFKGIILSLILPLILLITFIVTKKVLKSRTK